jgi:hypothetical protein
MKHAPKLGRLVAAAFVALLLAGCAGGGKATTPREPSSVPAPTGAIKPYPLKTCLVTGTALGAMGDPITKVYGNQEVIFCCDPCITEFEADPERFLKQLER